MTFYQKIMYTKVLKVFRIMKKMTEFFTKIWVKDKSSQFFRESSSPTSLIGASAPNRERQSIETQFDRLTLLIRRY